MPVEIVYDGTKWTVWRDGHYEGEASQILPESVTGQKVTKGETQATVKLKE